MAPRDSGTEKFTNALASPHGSRFNEGKRFALAIRNLVEKLPVMLNEVPTLTLRKNCVDSGSLIKRR